MNPESVEGPAEQMQALPVTLKPHFTIPMIFNQEQIVKTDVGT